MIANRLSPDFCAHNGVAVLEDDGARARLGMLDVGDAVLRARIEKAFPDSRVSFERVDEETLSLTQARMFSEDDGRANPSGAGTAAMAVSADSAIDRLDGDAPLVNLLNSVFLDAIARHASDIHIESSESGGRVRFRVDGRLLTAMSLSPSRTAALTARLKVLANVNVLETRRPQDGRISLVVGGDRLDARISIVPTVEGESVAVRLLNRKDKPLLLGELGFLPEHLAFLSGIGERRSGLIVVTGPTGSGKTTTLSAILRNLNRDGVKIVSLEDPVENRIEGIAQVPVNDGLGLTFDSLLRRVFRQDPDIVMIGEIRDPATAELSVRAALTGHLVLATLHTESAPEAVVRLEDMGIAPYLVASTLRAAIGQRLVRRLCPACRGAGCPACGGSGFAGRTVIAEIAEVRAALAEKIRSGATGCELERCLSAGGFTPIRTDAAAKVRAGVTTDEEVRSELGGSRE